jgi:hypothetical protein
LAINAELVRQEHDTQHYQLRTLLVTSASKCRALKLFKSFPADRGGWLHIGFMNHSGNPRATLMTLGGQGS